MLSYAISRWANSKAAQSLQNLHPLKFVNRGFERVCMFFAQASLGHLTY